jgi:hypothetical protein
MAGGGVMKFTVSTFDGKSLTPVEVREVELSPEQVKEQVKSELAATDKDMARVAEDVIGMLVAKNLLTADDMPDAVKAKIAERAALREQLTGDE